MRIISYAILFLLFYFNTSLPQVFTNINVSNQSAPQNETSVKISRVNPNRIVAVWRDFRNASDATGLRVGYSYSNDAGLTWSSSRLLDSTLLPNLVRNGDPVVTVDASGNFYISVLATNSSGNLTPAVYKSTDGGVNFPNAYIVTTSMMEDKEWITCDISQSSPYLNNLYLVWDRYSGTTGIKFSKSTNGGVNWSNVVQVSGFGSSEIAPGICVSSNGQINICWLSMTGSNAVIKYDRSTDGGNTFGTDITVSTGLNLPLTIGNVYTFPSIAVDNSSGPRSGWIYVTFADTRNGDYDVFMCRSTNSG